MATIAMFTIATILFIIAIIAMSNIANILFNGREPELPAREPELLWYIDAPPLPYNVVYNKIEIFVWVVHRNPGKDVNNEGRQHR